MLYRNMALLQNFRILLSILDEQVSDRIPVYAIGCFLGIWHFEGHDNVERHLLVDPLFGRGVLQEETIFF